MMSITSLVPFILSAIAVAATPALDLKVTAPAKVAGVENLKLVTTVTNTGDETIKLLNHPESVLDNTPTESFIVQHDDTGLNLKFVGIRAGYLAEMVIEMNDASGFTVLQPGESTEVTHDLSSVYDFTQTGEGKYTFHPSTTFSYIDPTTSKPATINAKSVTAQIAVSGSLTPAHGFSDDITGNCTNAQLNVLYNAALAANNLVNSVYFYTSALTGPTQRFTTWFGPYNPSSRARVLSVFKNLSGRGDPINDYRNYNFRCELQGSSLCPAGRYAYVYFANWPQVFICPFFFQLPSNQYAGFLTHEGSHFNVMGATRDYGYGEDTCKNLARTDPGTALYNADSYRFYAIYS